MATTIDQAFREFLTNTVNLAPSDTTGARTSRDWLLAQIDGLDAKHDEFPKLYAEKNLMYGSFARRTKIRELDDVDLLTCINAQGTTYLDYGTKVTLTVPNGIELRKLCHDGTDRLNSTKVINRFVKYLSEIPQYKAAEISRKGVAAVLNLSSYTWSFDIVPCFFTAPEEDARDYYIIPNGEGDWMKTDPRIDHERVESLNKTHNGNMLDPLRLLKYWNRRPTMPSAPPYLLECVALNHFQAQATAAVAWPDIELPSLLRSVASGILTSVPDPKGIQGDLNTLSTTDRLKIYSRATSDAAIADEAREAEQLKDQQKSIELWGKIFGPDFPSYG